MDAGIADGAGISVIAAALQGDRGTTEYRIAVVISAWVGVVALRFTGTRTVDALVVGGAGIAVVAGAALGGVSAAIG